MSKLVLFVLALVATGATMTLTATAQSTMSFTFTLEGTTYTDSACTKGGAFFSASITVDDSGRQPTQTCVADGPNRFVQGYCIPDNFEYGGQTFMGSYALIVYANKTCVSTGFLASASATSPIDTSACIALYPASAGYVKFSGCTSGDNNSSGSSKLKGGVIAAIVISCIVFAACVAIGAFVIYRKRVQARNVAREAVRAREVPVAPVVRPSNQAAASRIAVASPPSAVVSPSYVQMRSISPGGPLIRPAAASQPTYRPTYMQVQQPQLQQPYSPYTPSIQINPPGLYIPPPSFVPNSYSLPAAPVVFSSGPIVSFCSQCGTKAGSGPFCSGCGFKLSAGVGGGQIRSPSVPSVYSTDEGQIYPQQSPPPPPAYSTDEGVDNFQPTVGSVNHQR